MAPTVLPPPDPRYPRDLRGYGRHRPDPHWPGGARLALQFVLNLEEGAEASVLHGDAGSEQFLSELASPASYPARHLSMESVYEYGARVGVWRVLREFERRGLPLTVFGVGMALQRCPEIAAACAELGHEVACHGWRWIHYQQVDEATERRHLQWAVEAVERATGQPREAAGAVHALGWYTGRDSPNTRRLVADFGGFVYDSDHYGDELPLWLQVRRSDGALVPHLVVPYTLDCNDMRFALPQGFADGEPFFRYLRDAFDVHYAEGGRDPAEGGRDPAEAARGALAGRGGPAMMSIGLHARLVGRPGRLRALQRFLDHVQAHPGVWITRRIDIARHWRAQHPFDAATAFLWE
jgi:allantoinase